MEQETTQALPATQKVSREDFLEAEVLNVRQLYYAERVANIDLQIAELNRQKVELVGAMKTTRVGLQDLGVALSAKYGVAIGPTTVSPDGTIKTPMQNGSPPMERVGALASANPVKVTV
jgi:hypothetical protein